jgi:hypothetical protein
MPILCRRMVVSASRRGLRERPKECQLTFGTAHSEPTPPITARAIVDAGLKALAFDSGPPLVCDEPAATSERASDEHGRLGVSGATNRLQIGDEIGLVPAIATRPSTSTTGMSASAPTASNSSGRSPPAARFIDAHRPLACPRKLRFNEIRDLILFTPRNATIAHR